MKHKKTPSPNTCAAAIPSKLPRDAQGRLVIEASPALWDILRAALAESDARKAAGHATNACRVTTAGVSSRACV
jgi:hypothetical protein